MIPKKRLKERENTYLTELKNINIIKKIIKPSQNGLKFPQLPLYPYQLTMKAIC